MSVGSDAVTRTNEGSALAGEDQGAPRPGDEVHDETLSTGMRSMIIGWGGQPGGAQDDSHSVEDSDSEHPDAGS